MAEISVIIPVYNVEKYIRRCIDSILIQTFGDFEVLLIDDGSTDSSGTICDEYATKDNRICVIHQANAGVSAARNLAIEETLKRGHHWITFVDSDDWVNPIFLESLFNAAVRTNTKIAYGKYLYTEVPTVAFDNNTETELHTPTEWYLDSVDTLLAQAPWSKLFSAELFKNKEYRFPVGIRYEDSATMYKIIFSQKDVIKCNGAMYYYYVNPEGFMQTSWSPSRLQYIAVMKEQIAWLSEHDFDIAAGMAADTFLINLCEQFGDLSKIENTKKYQRKLQQEIRFILKTYKRQGKFTIKKNHWYYDVGYPRLMWVYWTVIAQLKKISNHYIRS